MTASAIFTRYRGRLRRMATGDTAMITVGLVLANGLRIVSSMTLTRLLDSAAFGVVAVITAVAFVLSMLSDVGVLPFLVRHERDDPSFLDQVWTLRLLRSVGLTLVMLVSAEPVAMFMGKPALAPVLMLWSVNFLIDGLASLSFATAIRARQLRRMTLLDLCVGVAQFTMSVVAVLAVRSYWSLVFAMLFGAAVKSILSYRLFPDSRRRWRWERERARELWVFSRAIAMSSLLSLMILQTDQVVLARLLPLSIFGFYAIAVTISYAPVGAINPYTQRLLFPIYADAARRGIEQLRAVFYPKRRLVVVGYMAMIGGLIGAAPLVTELLYDPRYRGVAPFLRLVAIGSMLMMPNAAAEQALIALGRTRATLQANIGRMAWLVVGGVTAIATGHVILLVAVVGTAELAAMLCHWWNLQRFGLLRLHEEMLGLGAASAAAGAASLIADMLLGFFFGV